jgi:hypothetical protein
MLRGEFFGALAATGVLGAAHADPDLEAASAPARLRRVRAIRAASAARVPLAGIVHRTNGDDERYAADYYLGSYAKGLPHDDRGRVDPAAYRTYLAALRSGALEPLSRIAAPILLNLVAATCDLGYEYEGDDVTQFDLPPAPTLASERTAADLIEAYWMARARDVPFARYADDSTIAAACAELATTPERIFRATGPAQAGPYISQFFYADLLRAPGPHAPHVAAFAVPGRDYLTTRDELIAMQRGPVDTPTQRETQPRYVSTLRDLGDYISRPFDLIGNTAALLASFSADTQQPYFDAIEMNALASRAQVIAGNAVYFQKFMVHRRVRPEAVALLVDRAHAGEHLPLHPTLLHSAAVDATLRANGNALLPQAYPTGSPPHPSYPAAHAIISSANITIFKAFMKGDTVFPETVEPVADGTAVVDQTRSPLTIGGELDKLASNYALGRCAAGVHFRADCIAGLRLGELAALSVLRDRAKAAPRRHGPFVVRTFDGKMLEIGG